ncbi:unnamed protein product, partial [Candidula unifasciata]
MTSPHVKFLERTDSLESFEGIFENDEETNDDDLVDTRDEHSETGSYNVAPAEEHERRCDPSTQGGDATVETPLLED